jgi:TIR domain
VADWDAGNPTQVDYFVSYTSVDAKWAEWIAWQLESAGFTTVLQAWDFLAGTDWAQEMQNATTAARSTIAVLSPAYLRSAFGSAEWRAAFRSDPTGALRRLIPVRVAPVDLEGLYATRTYLDLVGLTPDQARTALFASLAGDRRKPQREPSFPGQDSWAQATAERLDAAASRRSHSVGCEGVALKGGVELAVRKRKLRVLRLTIDNLLYIVTLRVSSTLFIHYRLAVTVNGRNVEATSLHAKQEMWGDYLYSAFVLTDGNVPCMVELEVHTLDFLLRIASIRVALNGDVVYDDQDTFVEQVRTLDS